MVTTRRKSGKLPPPKFSLKEGSGDEGDDNKEVEAVSADEEGDMPAKKKKSRRSSGKGGQMASKARGNRGKLAFLLKIPMDLMVEICSHLAPIDILNLARSTKSLRALFMHRSSKPMWRAARSTIDGLPDCPPDLSEAQYARLMFDTPCFTCGNAQCQKVDFLLRARCCRGCWRANVAWGQDIMDDDGDIDEEILSMSPYTQVYSTRRGPSKKRRYYYIPAVQEMRDRYNAILDDFGEGEELDKFVKEQQDLVPQILETAKTLTSWRNNDSRKRSGENDAIGRKRAAEIRTRLIELGWTEANNHNWISGEFSSLLHQPRELTPRIWKTILPKLEVILQRKREENLALARRARETERQGEIRGFYNELMFSEPLDKGTDKRTFPRLKDILILPSVAKFIRDNETPVTRDLWLASLDEIKVEVAEAQRKMRRMLVELLQEPATESKTEDGTEAAGGDTAMKEESEDAIAPPEDELATDTKNEILLRQASTFFGCSECSLTSLHYPEMLSHPDMCAHSWRAMYLRVPPFEFKSVPNVVKIAKRLLKSLSMPEDSPRYTITNMEGPFECLGCLAATRMNWEKIVGHFAREQEVRHWGPEAEHPDHHILDDSDRPLIAVVPRGETPDYNC